MTTKTEFTPENKFRWISRMYFSVSDNPKHDVNPFSEMDPFLKAKISEMSWGANKQEAKEKMVHYLTKVFDLYDFKIPKDKILKGLENESQTNTDFIKYLGEIGEFPIN